MFNQKIYNKSINLLFLYNLEYKDNLNTNFFLNFFICMLKSFKVNHASKVFIKINYVNKFEVG